MNSPTQPKVFSTVWHRSGVFRKDIEAITGFHPNTVARAVDSLLAKGYRWGSTLLNRTLSRHLFSFPIAFIRMVG